MNRQFGYGIGIVVVGVLLLGAILVGSLSYNAGYSEGIVQGAVLTAPANGAEAAVPYYWRGAISHRPFGFGFGGFGLCGLLFFGLFFLLAIGLLRRSFWRGPRGGWGQTGQAQADKSGESGSWWQRGGPPPIFEEWHRRAHAEAPPPETPDATPPIGENRGA